MNFDKYTIRAQEAVQAAVQSAQLGRQQSVEPLHLLKGIMEKGKDTLNFIFQKLGANAHGVEMALQNELQHLPKVDGGQPYFSNETTLEKIRDFFVKQIYFNHIHTVLEFIMKVFQVFVYLFTFVFTVVMYKRKNEFFAIIPIAFIGGTSFNMIWEAKSRYIFPYFVFLIPLAAYGLVIVRNKIKEYKKLKEEKDEKSTI